MTRQGSFKRAVRQRARATGERYTEARAALEQGKTAERRPRPFERAALAAHLEAHYGTRISSLALIDDEASRPRGSWEGATIRRRGAVARDGGSEEHDGGFYVGRPSQDLAAAMNTLASVEDAVPPEGRERFEWLRDQVEQADGAEGLPEALTHGNYHAWAAVGPPGRLVIVGWAGSGLPVRRPQRADAEPGRGVGQVASRTHGPAGRTRDRVLARLSLRRRGRPHTGPVCDRHAGWQQR